MEYILQPTQYPKNASKAAKNAKIDDKIMAVKIRLKKYKSEIVKQKIKPVLAANILGPAFIIFGATFNIFNIILFIMLTGLQEGLIKDLIKKSIPNKNISHLY